MFEIKCDIVFWNDCHSNPTALFNFLLTGSLESEHTVDHFADYSETCHKEMPLVFPTGSTRFSIECKFCHGYFQSVETMREHLQKDHGRDFLEICRTCQRWFFSVSGFKNHTCVSEDCQFRCEICEKGFRYNSTLQIHMKSHSEERKNQCPKCFKLFKHKYCLKTHTCKWTAWFWTIHGREICELDWWICIEDNMMN